MDSVSFKDYLQDYLEVNNITNKEFSKRINITPKHLIDILNGDKPLTGKVIENISIVTKIPVEYIFKVEMNYKFEKKICDYLDNNNFNKSSYLNKFNYKYLINNNYISFTDATEKLEVIKDILKFLRVTSPDAVYEIDENILYKSKNDKYELLVLWLEKCYQKTLKQNVLDYDKKNIKSLVSYINKCAMDNIFNEEELIKYFNQNGVFLVIEEDIPGAKIRGAFKVHRNKPAIYITYKHKRIADIYFALLHEVAHMKRDFNKAKGQNLVSYDKDNIESYADILAYDYMVPKDYLEKIVKDKNYDVSKEVKYPKSFIVYLLAKNGYIKYSDNIYQKYNILI